MSGWVPFDAAGWPDVVEVLQASGGPWPRAAAIYDLRWHHDQCGRVPGRRSLRKRWGWTDRQARSLLANVEEWWDPSKGVPPASRERPGAVPEASRERPGSSSKEEDEPSPASRERPGAVPEASRERPGDVHTRVDPPSPSPSPSPSPPENRQTSTVDPGGGGEVVQLPGVEGSTWEVINRTWGEARVAAGYNAPTTKLKASRGYGRKLKPLLREHGVQAVLDVMRWWGSSPDGRAAFLREDVGKGGKSVPRCGLETLIRNFDAYLERARCAADTDSMAAIERDQRRGVYRQFEGSNEF